MLLQRSVNAWNLSKWTIGCYTAALAYVVFLQVQFSMGDRMVAITSMKTEPPVELTRLRFDLLAKYQKTVRPLKDQKDVLTVQVFYDIYHVVSLDEKYQTLSVNGKLKVFWTDEFLTWDPKNYSGITMIRFSAENIWWPDLLVQYNVKPHSLYEKKRSPPITVSNNGSVQWFPTVHCAVPCSANYKHYPFDSHNCSVIIFPQAYNDSGVAVVPYRSESNVKHVGTEWELKGVTHESEMVHEFYYSYLHQQVRIRIFLERVSRLYRYICVIPTLASMVSLLFGFWLLPTETSRYIIGCSNIIVLTMLLQHMVVTIPAGRVIPLIAQYSASCLSMSAIFILATVLVNFLRERSGKAPDFLLRLAHLTMERHLCIFTFSHQAHRVDEDPPGSTAPEHPKSGTTPTPEQEEELQRLKEWRTVSVLVDRIFFWCFAFIFAVLLGVLAAV